MWYRQSSTENHSPSSLDSSVPSMDTSLLLSVMPIVSCEACCGLGGGKLTRRKETKNILQGSVGVVSMTAMKPSG